MPAPIDFYFDFSSPYGYFASTRIDALAAKHGRDVNWRPILLGAVFKVTGAQPLPSLPLKGAYARKDIARCARALGVPYQFPSRFPISGVAPARTVIWAQSQDPAQAKRLAKALYRAFFADDRDISSAETSADVAAGLGYDRGAVLAGMNEQPVKDQLKAQVDAAIEQGVFGSPYIVVDGEPFWGHDRFDHVDKWLETGGW